MANRLAQETSPYLLQHRDNPVDWYPWGEEALARAREEDRPILLSVGYSACHWCHVMERESFEDAETAAYMNEHFVSVKVDREERPDVDALYMEAVQAISGQGGWPMTVFLDPEGVPFYGGTYFPPDEGRGMPSFRMVMEAVVDAFERKREEIRERAPADARAARRDRRRSSRRRERARGGRCWRRRSRSCAPPPTCERGGFGGAPKFPPASALELLLARGEREVVERTLDAMLAGGIYDQLGGGFARYSVDAAWLVPHFEKMLYDNALLARAYLHGWQALGHERYRRVCEETLDWVLREMRGPEGGFYSALDADSEGEEGRFYVWTPERDPRRVLGERAPSADAIERSTGSARRGNFEGRNILHLAGGADAPEPEGLDAMRRGALRGARQAGLAGPRRQAPHLLERADDRRPGRGRRRARPRGLPRRRPRAAPSSCSATLRDADGRLLRTYKDGDARLNAYLEDHAFLLEALLTLYEATFEPRWFERARALADDDDRPLRRPRARRLLLHLRRPRGS